MAAAPESVKTSPADNVAIRAVAGPGQSGPPSYSFPAGGSASFNSQAVAVGICGTVGLIGISGAVGIID